ncbi:uncharacterized protein [Watersipora subatra]|uniref:uncharacterized protein n=1 Tax=Watersipora subatra TaxID=2589382 RepID=UPI00355C8366
MCGLDLDGKEISYTLPVYFTTPDFTDLFGHYDSSYFCQCKVESSADVKVLYKDIEPHGDCLEFGTDLSTSCKSSTPATSYSFSSQFAWIFKTGSNNTKKRAWFKISNGSKSELKIICSPPSWTAAAVTGGMVAAGGIIVILVVIGLVFLTRSLKAQQRNTSIPIMVGTDTIPLQYTPTPVQGQTSVSTPDISSEEENPNNNRQGETNQLVDT